VLFWTFVSNDQASYHEAWAAVSLPARAHFYCTVTLLYSKPKKAMAIGMHGNINEPQATPGCPFPPMAALTAKIGILVWIEFVQPQYNQTFPDHC
ncbi:hypothetical protein MCOR11_010134, partial [Pyricularia oryzae]